MGSQAASGLTGKGLVMATRRMKTGVVERCQPFAISDFVQRPREVDKVPPGIRCSMGSRIPDFCS